MANFSLASLKGLNGPAPALVIGDEYYTLAALDNDFAHMTMRELLVRWDMTMPRLKDLAGKTPHTEATHCVEVLTPILYPDSLLAVGASYSGRLKQMGLEVEKWDVMPFFVRPSKRCLAGPGRTVRIPCSTRQFDWEVELAIVVGRKLRHASRTEAADGIAGYTIGLDLSCRDLIPVNNELLVDVVRGEAQDTMAPCGPAIMPAEFVGDIDDLRIELWINDQQTIDAQTSKMLYKCDEILAEISKFITLVSGDICFTGSPSGSAALHGNCWLRNGDKIKATIEQIGTLEVTCFDDKEGNEQ